ncbi:MAG: DUF6807 family protein [Limisphaerales bacterium]
MSDLSRRDLLKTAAVSAGAMVSTSTLAQTPPNEFKVEDQRPFRAQTRRLKITNHGRYVTSFIFSVDYPTHFRLKPEFYPVLTPAGYPVTDSHQYCFIHHQSIMSGHGRVRTEDGRVIDFYRKLNFPETDRPDKWHTSERNLYHLGPTGIQEITGAKWTTGESVKLDLELTWRTREQNSAEGEPILYEQRHYELTQSGPHTIIDSSSQLIPVKGTIVLEEDRHSFCGVRVNDLIDVEEGGTMRDSEGRVNPDGNYWDADGDRKAPRWIDCTGRLGEATVGITLMGHPENIRNQYYMRDWGLMEVSPCLNTEVEINAASPFRFAARYVAHDGKIAPETNENLLRDFGK